MRTDNQNNPITEGNIWKEIILFCLPIMAGTLFQQLYNATDVAIIGHFAGTMALASVGGSSGIIVYMVVVFFVGISSGVTVVIARLFGADKTDELRKAIHTSAALSIAGGVIFGILGVLFAPTFLRFLNTPEEILDESTIYLRIYFVGLVFILFLMLDLPYYVQSVTQKARFII